MVVRIHNGNNSCKACLSNRRDKSKESFLAGKKVFKNKKGQKPFRVSALPIQVLQGAFILLHLVLLY